MTAPEKIYQLVETFEQNLNEYKTRKNETELRRQFLDPFFEALGWDVGNTKGYDERRKEVAHELSVEIDGQQKKADYAFRTGTDKFDFLVEAKKPSVNIETSAGAAFQLRRYGWSAKLPLNILTDFEHLAVYDCRSKPSHKDKVSTGRVAVYHYKDYAEKWDEIAALFSPDAIRKGALDKFTEGMKGKKGTADVDDDFLMEIERWREALARNIALRNKHLALNEAQLNYAVQMTIDRIVFLRIAEERGMEEYGRLLGIALTPSPSPKGGRGESDDGENQLYGRLKRVFIQADERYNSGLFHFRAEKSRKNPDTVTPDLQIDDKVLKDIIENLYEPKSPYAFAYIPADILGSVYERFLGKVIRLTAGGQAKVEDKPEVRKAGGVYYTPTYIVDYIVRNTVGRLLSPLLKGEGSGVRSEFTPTPSPDPGGRGESLTPADVSKLKIVDPACGSGSFLLGAYQFLLDWHLDWYVTHDLEKALKRKVILTQDNKTFRLSMDEKKRILLDNIFGVDLDPQAVEVTKLSLLLKVVEDPGQLTLFSEGHILPDLGNNIQCGNSLIGMDYFDGQMELMVNGDEMRRVNPFDWKSAFPQVFVQGGFDAVIGNPPYIRIQAMQEWASEQVEFYKKKYTAASKGNYDIYVIFIEKGLSLLNAKGRLGFILPHKFFNAQYGEPVRGVVAKGKHLANIVHFGDQQIFSGATTYTCLLFLDKSGHDEFEFVKVNDLDAWRNKTSEVSETSEVSGTIRAENVTSAEWNFTVGRGAALFEKLSGMPVKLGDVTDRIFQGLVTGADPVFILEVIQVGETTSKVFSKASQQEVEIENSILRPLLKGAEIKRFEIDEPLNVIVYPYKVHNGKAFLLQEKELKKDYPLTWDYLLSVRNLLEARESGKWQVPQWWQYGRNQNIFEMTKGKLLTQVLSKRGSFTLDNEGKFCFVGGGNAGGYGILVSNSNGLSENYILGLLNSQLLNSYIRNISTPFRGGYFSYARRFIEQLPIRAINFADPAERAQHDQLVSLVERMLALTPLLSPLKSHGDAARGGSQTARTPQEREAIQRQIEATDKAIDALVYQLYGLTEEEIRNVENSE